MRRSKYRRAARSPKRFTGRHRIVAAVATLVAFGGIVTVTQVSDAGTQRSTERALAACDRLQAPTSSNLSTETKTGTYTTDNGTVTQHSDDGASDVPTTTELRSRCRQWVLENAGNDTDGGDNGAATPSSAAPAPDASDSASPAPDTSDSAFPAPDISDSASPVPDATGGQDDGGAVVTPPPGAGLGILTNTCEDSDLEPHTGFQLGNKCVSTEFGEVGAAADNPTLLITDAPEKVNVGEPFTIRVSTRNLIRDRFLAAGQGGYYVESSVLQDGLVRGHFHTACRILGNTDEAPDPAPVPAFFVATEDSKGGAQPDIVSIQVPGIKQAGTAQCASWAGDGSHRIPMMQRANQTPAFDAVRIQVKAGGDAGDSDG